MRTVPGSSHALTWLLMLLSGMAGLGYQIVWMQQCALWIGHESAAVLAVMAAFFGGLACGAGWLGRMLERSEQPVRWYVLCEVVIGGWGALLLWIMAPASEVLLGWIGAESAPWRHWLIAFGGTFALLLPATLAMGATLPAMARIASPDGTSGLAGLYASNTLGAVLGVTMAAFVLIPRFGLAATLWACIGLNGLCAALASVGLSSVSSESTRSDDAEWDAVSSWRPVWPLVVTGLLGIGYEVLIVRVLSQVAEDTVYTYTLMLVVYLIGTALGAAAYQRWCVHRANEEGLQDKLIGALALACLLGSLSLWGSESVLVHAHAWTGEGMSAAIAGEGLLALLAFALPTFFMGALFSHLCVSARQQGVPVGVSLAINTLGAAAAPPVIGVWLAPMLGPKWALLCVCAGYLLLCRRKAWRSAWFWAPAITAASVAGLAPALAFISVPDGGQVLSYQEGVAAAVSVVADAQGVARLRINNRQQEGSSATLLVDGRQAMLPILLQPAAHRVLFLGLGTGVTSGTAAEDLDLHVDAVELLPEVIEASRHFWSVFDRADANPRLHVIAADARRFVRASSQHYDLIIADNFQPARSGSGALYTVEHFAQVKSTLTPDGLFCQWLPLHQLDINTLRSIVRSFMSVYPDGVAVLASNSLETPVIGLVGKRSQTRFALPALKARLSHMRSSQPPAAFGLADEWSVLGSVVAGPQALSRFAASARANTDDLPVVAYGAPRITYRADSQPRERLMALLQDWSVRPQEVLAGESDPATAQRLAAYWHARNAFIALGQGIRPSADVREMLAQVAQPLKQVLATSADFRPAYEPLVGMAMALSAQDQAAARALLRDLIKLQPAWPQARQALAQLPG